MAIPHILFCILHCMKGRSSTMPVRLPPDNPEEWLRRARSSLAIARCREPDICREDLYYQAQKAAEKAIKAVFIAHALPFPHICEPWTCSCISALKNIPLNDGFITSE